MGTIRVGDGDLAAADDVILLAVLALGAVEQEQGDPPAVRRPDGLERGPAGALADKESGLLIVEAGDPEVALVAGVYLEIGDTAAVGEPGTPSEIIGSNAEVPAACAAVSGATTPSICPVPNL